MHYCNNLSPTFVEERLWKHRAKRVPNRAPSTALNRAPSLLIDVEYLPVGDTSAYLQQNIQ